MDGVEENNIHIWDMITKMNDKFDDGCFKLLMENNCAYKLTYKDKLSPKTKDGELTIYGYLVSKYLGKGNN